MEALWELGNFDKTCENEDESSELVHMARKDG